MKMKHYAFTLAEGRLACTTTRIHTRRGQASLHHHSGARNFMSSLGDSAEQKHSSGLFL